MNALLVGIDVGCRKHRVAIGMPDGKLLEQFDLAHRPMVLMIFSSVLRSKHCR